MSLQQKRLSLNQSRSKCVVDGCGKIALRAGGYCFSHHSQFKAKEREEASSKASILAEGDEDVEETVSQPASPAPAPVEVAPVSAAPVGESTPVDGPRTTSGSTFEIESKVDVSGTPAPVPQSVPQTLRTEVSSNRKVCLGHACQGQIDDGYCLRHKTLSNEVGDKSGVVSRVDTKTAEMKKKSGAPLLPSSIVQFTVDRKGGKETLEGFLQAIHSISSEIEPHKAAEKIIQETCRLLDAERATLYYCDQDELILVIAKGAKNIRLPKSRGVAGHVATSGLTVNIFDAHAEPMFDPSFDVASGFRTRNILATPVFDASREVIAVLQCINKQSGQFTREDEIIIQNLAFHCSVVLRNASLYEASKQAEAKVSSLLEIVEMLHSDPNINSLIFTLNHRAHSLVGADRSTLYLVDKERQQLAVMTGDVDIRIPLSKGIAGACATNGEIINIPDCYKDDRFNRSVDLKTGYRTRSMLCMPIFVEPKEGKECIGVLQIINRLDDQEFTREDERILRSLLKIAGPLLKQSAFFQKQAQTEKGSEAVGFGARVVPAPKFGSPSSSGSTLGALPEKKSNKKPSLGLQGISEGPLGE